MHFPNQHPITIPDFFGQLICSLSRYPTWSTIVVTYLFWATFSLVNFSFFFPLALPFMLLATMKFYMRFADFLMAPVLTAALSATLCWAIAALIFRRVADRRAIRFLMPLLFNAVFLATLLVSAERAKTVAIEAALQNRKPDCISIASFSDSLDRGGQEHAPRLHATFSEGGRMYYWSYAAMKFHDGGKIEHESFGC